MKNGLNFETEEKNTNSKAGHVTVGCLRASVCNRDLLLDYYISLNFSFLTDAPILKVLARDKQKHSKSQTSHSCELHILHKGETTCVDQKRGKCNQLQFIPAEADTLKSPPGKDRK